MKHFDASESQASAPEADPEFDFSKRLVSPVAPYPDLGQAQARTWRRLSQSSKRHGEQGVPRALRWQPSVLVAVCLLTFVGGVWVGKGQRPVPPDALTVSAEPMELGQGVQRRGAIGLNVERPVDVVGMGSAVASTVHETNSPSAVLAGDRLARVTARGRAQGNSTAGASPGPIGLDVPNAVAHSMATVVDGPLQPAPAAPKTNSSHTTWHALANQGEYEAALVEIAQAGGYERVLETANPEQLMLLSDVARATGQQQRALAALKRIVNEHSSDPVAPLAALNLGNLLDKMGDGAGATRAFARYRALSPKGEFAEDALVRQLRSAVKAGKRALAHKLVRQYEADFPDGRSASEVAELSEEIPEAVIEADAGASR